jgi:hypothetical protein
LQLKCTPELLSETVAAWQDLLGKAVAQAAEAYPPSSTSAELLAARAPKNRWSYPFDGNEMMAFNDLPVTPGAHGSHRVFATRKHV